MFFNYFLFLLKFWFTWTKSPGHTRIVAKDCMSCISLEPLHFREQEQLQQWEITLEAKVEKIIKTEGELILFWRNNLGGEDWKENNNNNIRRTKSVVVPTHKMLCHVFLRMMAFSHAGTAATMRNKVLTR